jgi:hypothetical protein
MKEIITKSDYIKYWPEIVKVYTEKIRNYRNYEENEVVDSNNIIFFLLKEMAETAIAYGKFKDTWEFGFAPLEGWGQETIVKSIKTGHAFRIGINPECIYVISEVDNSQNLKYMENEFWEIIMQLSKVRKFKFEEHTFSNPEHRKTNIMRLMSTYMNSEQTEKNIGFFDMEWNINQRIEFVLFEFCEVFKCLYRLNYMLWKTGDLKNKRIKRGERKWTN